VSDTKVNKRGKSVADIAAYDATHKVAWEVRRELEDAAHSADYAMMDPAKFAEAFKHFSKAIHDNGLMKYVDEMAKTAHLGSAGREQVALLPLLKKAHAMKLEDVKAEADKARCHVHWIRPWCEALLNLADTAEKPGPQPPNTLVWNGERHELQSQDWKLLNALWGHDSRPEAEVIDEVWGHDSEPTPSALKSALYRLNNKMLECGAPAPAQWGQKNGYFRKL